MTTNLLNEKLKELDICCLCNMYDISHSNKPIILEAIKILPEIFSQISDELRDDEEIALLAVSNNCYYNVKYSSERLKENKSFILLAIENNNYLSDHVSILCDISIILCNDFDVVLKAVSKCCDEFQYASDELRNNKIIITAAINAARLSDKKHTSEFIKYLSKRLQNNFDIMLDAVVLCARNINYISNELKNNKIFINTVVDIDLCTCSLLYRSICKIIPFNKQMILKIISKGEKIGLHNIPNKFRDDDDIILHYDRTFGNEVLKSRCTKPYYDTLTNYIQVNEIPCMVYTINNDGSITNIAGKLVYKITDSNMTFSELSKILYNIKHEYMSFINIDGEKITPFDGYTKIIKVYIDVKIL